MHWLAKVISHHFNITSVLINVFSNPLGATVVNSRLPHPVNHNGITQTTTGDLEEEEKESGTLVRVWRKRKVAFMPSLGEF